MKKILTIVVSLHFILLSGCATIVGDGSQKILINSKPGDATIKIFDKKRVEVFNGLTPTTAMLEKSDGSYFGKKNYTVEISKKGYKKQIIPVTASANTMYIVGNLFFSSFIGWFVVDPFGGEMYTLSPESISTYRDEQGYSHNNDTREDNIAIDLIKNAPKLLKKKMKKVTR